MRKTSYALLTALLLLPAMGCEHWSGGGWIYSAIGTEAKATMGFNFDCQDTAVNEVAIHANFQYQDHGVTVTAPNGKERKLAFHGQFDETISEEGVSCENLDAWFMDVFGADGFLVEYQPQPPTMGEGGAALILLEDSGQQGAPPKADGIWIILEEGVFDGYENLGFLQGGQITLHQN